MTREVFIDTIEALQNQDEHDSKCAKAFKTILHNDYVSNYDNHWLTNLLVKILQMSMNDEGKNSTIEYFLYELDFGRKYTEGCITDNGENIDLSDAGKLWDYLNSNLEI